MRDDRSFGHQLVAMLEICCDEAVRMGASDWFMQAQRSKLAQLARGHLNDERSRVGVTGVLNTLDDLTRGLRSTEVFDAARAEVLLLWPLYDAECRLGGG